MKNAFRSVVGAALAGALLGCQPAPDAQTPHALPSAPKTAQPEKFSAFDAQPFPLLIGLSDRKGRAPSKLNGLDNAQLRDALTLLNEVDCGDYKACARKLRAELNKDKSLRRDGKLVGLGSSGVYTLINVAENTAEGADATVWTKGQIQPQCLAADGSIQKRREGYSYDKAGKLRICVVVVTTMVNAEGENVSTFEYFEVEARDARIERSCVDNPPGKDCSGASDANVFPVAAQKTGLEIPKFKTTPVPGVQLNWKLYAWGANIAVKRYGLIENVVWTAPNSEPSPMWSGANLYDRWQGHGQLTQRLRKLFTPSDKACVDMMFVDRPPASLAVDERTVYCLGRCKQPPILNTL